MGDIVILAWWKNHLSSKNLVLYPNNYMSIYRTLAMVSSSDKECCYIELENHYENIEPSSSNKTPANTGIVMHCNIDSFPQKLK